MGGFLVCSGDRRILIDAGLGRIDNERYRGGTFLESLQGWGVKVEDITDVVFTHLHFDHVGWATQKGAVVFPNATYRVHTADWEHFVESNEPSDLAVRKLSPLLKQLETFDRDGALLPGLSARHTPGHTPGSTVYIVSEGAERALFLGDVVHSPVELSERDWEAVFDLDPVAASSWRNTIADEVADSTDVVVGAHFPGLKFGRVVTASGRRTYHEVSGQVDG